MSSLFNAPISITNITRPVDLFVWDVTSDGTVVTAPQNTTSTYLHQQHSHQDEPSQHSHVKLTSENRRLYVGSMDYSIQEEMIREIFKSFGSIDKIEMPKEPSGQSRGYCFIEFHSPESVIDALSVMNNYNFVGRPLKVRLPSNAPQIDHSRNLEQHAKRPDVQLKWEAAVRRGLELNLYSPQAAAATQTAQPSQTAQVDRRIYVGSIDFQVTKEQIMDLFSSFGNILNMNMIMNPETGQHRGFGFIEYDNIESAESAIRAMDGQSLFDRKMIVRKAKSNSSNSATAPGQPAAALNNKLHPSSAVGSSTMGDVPLVSLSLQLEGLEEIPDPMAYYYPSLPPVINPLLSNPTDIICIHGLIPVEQFNNENLNTLREDLLFELSKFGTVLEVTPMIANGSVKVYVRYSDTSGSQKASIALKNRSFDSKPISRVSFVPSIPSQSSSHSQHF